MFSYENIILLQNKSVDGCICISGVSSYCYFVAGLSVFQFELSYNSSMLNIWTHTPLMLAGLAAPQDPKPVIARDTHSMYRE